MAKWREEYTERLTLGSLALLVIVFFGALGYAMLSVPPGDRPCHEYRNYPIVDVPARCVGTFQ